MSLRFAFRSIPVSVAVAVAVASAPPSARAGDAKVECVAAADQGQSLRDDGMYRRAREQFVTCARAACPKVVSKSCLQWLREIDQSMPTVVLGAKDDHGNDVAAVEVTVDGEPLAERLDGKPLPLDPGEHVLHFELEGSSPAEQKVVLRAGEKNRLVVVTLRSPAPVPAAPGEVVPQPSAPPADATASSRDGFFTARNVTVLSLFVLAAGAGGAGYYFGSQSHGDADRAASLRATIPSNACTRDSTSATCQSLSDAVDAQNREATLNQTLYIAGGALATAAIVTWIVWPRSTSKKEQPTSAWVAPAIGPGHVGVGVGGRW
jgi:hypothetical protein